MRDEEIARKSFGQDVCYVVLGFDIDELDLLEMNEIADVVQ